MRPSWLILATAVLILLCIVAGIVLYTKRTPPPPAVPRVVAPVTAQVTPQPAPVIDPVIDLFNPSQAALAEQLNDSALKNRLEDLVVLAFVLRRCGYLSIADYNDSFAAYARYAQTSPGALDSAIESASASYSLLYGHAECDSTKLPTAAMQLAQWRHAILNPPTQ